MFLFFVQRRGRQLVCLIAALLTFPGWPAAPLAFAGPLRIHPENPRFFSTETGTAIWLTGAYQWDYLHDGGTDGRPAFDRNAYLDLLVKKNHNFVRMWIADHHQNPGLRPYARTGPGTAADGGPRWDLSQFNQAFFDDLHQAVLLVQDKGIYVSVMFFEGWTLGKYTHYWQYNPFKGGNNINSIDAGQDGRRLYSLDDPRITAYQDAYVKKVINTLNGFDNLMWEIANEAPTTSRDWQYHMTQLTKQYERGKPKQHLVGMSSTGAPENELFGSPADWVAPPGASASVFNRALSLIGADKLIGVDKWAGFRPSSASNGSKIILWDNDHITGSTGYDPQWPWKALTRAYSGMILLDRTLFGGSFDAAKTQTYDAMGYARSYADRMNLASMTPQPNLCSTTFCLANSGSEYLIYQPDVAGFSVDLAPGTYSVEWFNPMVGSSAPAGSVRGGLRRNFTAPFGGSAVLYLKRAQ
jgi:hypothetical protein